MVALIVLILLLAILGGLGFAAHVLWWILIAAHHLGDRLPDRRRRRRGRRRAPRLVSLVSVCS